MENRVRDRTLEQNLEILGGQRRQVLRLANLQAKLRAAFDKKCHTEKLPGTNERAKRLKLEWSEMHRYETRVNAVCGGKILKALIAFLDLPNMAKEINDAATGLRSPLCGLSLSPLNIIGLAFDMAEAHLRYGGKMTHEIFARAFTPHDQAALALLRTSQDGLRELESQAETIQAMRNLLDDEQELRNHLAAALAQQQKDMAEPLAELKRLVAQLLAVHKTTRRLAPVLEVHATTMYQALGGKVSGETMTGLLTRARRLCNVNVPTAPAVAADTSTATHLVQQLGGEVSPLGVQYVLGPNSFRQIEGDPGETYVQFAQRTMEMARLALNIGSQIKDPETRRRLREKLGREVEELELAVRLFTSVHPNRLTALHEAQRQDWGKPDASKKTT